jgi:protein gp37
MSTATRIEWTRGDDGSAGATWNPVTGCTKVSEGCDHCYAATLARRLKAMGNPRYQHDGPDGPGFRVTLHPDKLTQPLGWRTPRRVFVNSMSDLFHDQVPDAFIAGVFAVMALAHRHTFQVLTKRPGRMASLLARPAFLADVVARATSLLESKPRFHRRLSTEGWTVTADSDPTMPLWVPPWPLHNVWLGTSVEDQGWATVRLAKLAQTPAVVRFASCEPLLDPVDLRRWLTGGLEWVIAGGESGPGHRPVDPPWVRSIRDQATAAGVAFFFKQWGGPTPGAGGRLLDGRTWDQYPPTGAEATTDQRQGAR